MSNVGTSYYLWDEFECVCVFFFLKYSVHDASFCCTRGPEVCENKRIAHGFERHTLILLGIHNVTDKWIVGLIYNFMFHIHMQPTNSKLQTANSTMRRWTVYERRAIIIMIRMLRMVMVKGYQWFIVNFLTFNKFML